MALGAAMVYWQAAQLGTLRSTCSVLVNIQFILSALFTYRFPASAEIADAISQGNWMGLMGVLASMSYPFILSQYVINISSPRFLYEKSWGSEGEERLFVGPSRLAGLNVAIFSLVPFFFFGSVVDGVFISQFASERSFEMHYWGHLIFGDALLFLCQLVATFFFCRFISVVMTTVSAAGMSFVMGSRSGTAALLLFLGALFLVKMFRGRRTVVTAATGLKRRRRAMRALRTKSYAALLLVLLGGAILLLRTTDTDWTNTKIVKSVFTREITNDESLTMRVDLAACHSARYLSHPDEMLFGADFNAGNCSGYLHSALSVFQVLGVVFSLPTLILVASILVKFARTPAFSLRVLLLLAPSLIVALVARFGFGFFLPTVVLFLRIQETYIRVPRFARPRLYPSIFCRR
jgi:hypothetical protein